MPTSKTIRAELEKIRLRLLDMLVPLQTADDAKRDQTGEKEHLRRALWNSIRHLDSFLYRVQLPRTLDLTKDDPKTQQLLHEMVVREYFSVHLLADEGEIDVPRYTPEECGMRVFHQYGRWFVTWARLEHEKHQEPLTHELFRLSLDTGGQLVFIEV